MKWLALIAAVAVPASASLPSRADGIIRHYVRSNSDGSEPEHVVHFRPTRTTVAVYKWVEKCTTAAYVTAQMDPGAWEPFFLDAGKVAKDGSQARFGRIDFDPATRVLSARIDLPETKLADTAFVADGMPWFLFDYDLADLNAYLQERRPKADFTFQWMLVWPDNGSDFLAPMATVRAAHRGIERFNGRTARRFDLHFVAGREGSGLLLVDPRSGAIIEARASVPNHPGMKDFRLTLDRDEPGGQAAWDALTRGHYARCPA